MGRVVPPVARSSSAMRRWHVVATHHPPTHPSTYLPIQPPTHRAVNHSTAFPAVFQHVVLSNRLSSQEAIIQSLPRREGGRDAARGCVDGRKATNNWLFAGDVMISPGPGPGTDGRTAIMMMSYRGGMMRSQPAEPSSTWRLVPSESFLPYCLFPFRP